MRLLNIHTLRLEEFFERDIPRYYILSHRWGKGEISFKDYVKHRNLDGLGYQKILDACAIARKFEAHDHEKVDWIWIDTCCIDKRSSAELSEAINSMFSWYKKAVTCFVYLADVKSGDANKAEAIGASEWFRRGWTLQELLAPNLHIFFDSAWKVLGHICPWANGSVEFCEDPKNCAVYFHRPSLLKEISTITGISEKYVQYSSTEYALPSVAQRMSWAAKRSTTRIEDVAYCLLGIFNVNMPLLYGEGRKAFLRLQDEIVKQTTDQSIFAWRLPKTMPEKTQSNHDYIMGMLAPEPSWFDDSSNMVFHQGWTSKEQRAFYITNNGLELYTALKRTSTSVSGEDQERAAVTQSRVNPIYFLELNCKYSSQFFMKTASSAIKLHFGAKERRAAKNSKNLAPVLIPLAPAEHSTSSSDEPITRFRRLHIKGLDSTALQLEDLPARRIYINAHTKVRDLTW